MSAASPAAASDETHVNNNNSNNNKQQQHGKRAAQEQLPADGRKRVLIVGAGAAGMSAAYAFAQSPEKFNVKVYDKSQSVGGSATSYQLPAKDGKSGKPYPFGAEFINDGVQGASPVFHNTFRMFEDVLGYKATEVGMQISFGKGKESFWSNVFPSELVDKFSDDIKKVSRVAVACLYSASIVDKTQRSLAPTSQSQFGRVLQTIKRFEVFFAVIPVSKMLSMFRFSPEFGERMVYPLVALFFGTGNETKHISSAILERVFLDPSMRLFEFSEESLLASVPTMMAFPELARVYGTWKEMAEAQGNVHVELLREVVSVERGTKTAKTRGGNVLVRSRLCDKEGKPLEEGKGGGAGMREEVFDELIMACDADSALKILQAPGSSGATWKEKKVLGNVLYKWDTTITHHDYDYMQKYYQMTYDEQYNAERTDEESKKAFEFAKQNWRPLYLIHMYEHDPSFIEMSFDLTHYQPQFAGQSPTGEGSRIKVEQARPTQRQGVEDASTIDPVPPKEQSEGKEPPKEQHVYQTIYLNKEMSEYWTDKDVDPEKIILQKWWKQQSHRWQLYAFTVPWLWSINGKNHTQFAGGWTLVNMHEVAICSGFSAAYALGAKYPFADNKDAKRLMGLVYLLQHMGRLRSEDRDGIIL